TVFGLATQAQELPKIDASVSYSYLRANPATSGVGGFNLNGGSASASYNFRDWLGGVADFGGYHVGSANGVNVDNHVTTYLFGPRFTYRNSRRITPFAHVLLGTAGTGAGTFATSRFHRNCFPLQIIIPAETSRIGCPVQAEGPRLRQTGPLAPSFQCCMV